jgi:hypothetical protein
MARERRKVGAGGDDRSEDAWIKTFLSEMEEKWKTAQFHATNHDLEREKRERLRLWMSRLTLLSALLTALLGAIILKYPGQSGQLVEWLTTVSAAVTAVLKVGEMVTANESNRILSHTKSVTKLKDCCGRLQSHCCPIHDRLINGHNVERALVDETTLSDFGQQIDEANTPAYDVTRRSREAMTKDLEGRFHKTIIRSALVLVEKRMEPMSPHP